MSHFQEFGRDTNLAAAVVGPEGLREAQLGALMALAAHSTVSEEPAQLVLPTGVGKTAVAALAPYLLLAERVLVVVPGKLIRSQWRQPFAIPRTPSLPERCLRWRRHRQWRWPIAERPMTIGNAGETWTS